VLEAFFGYPEILCVVYLEVAARMGITCEPIYLNLLFSPEKLFLKCWLFFNELSLKNWTLDSN
jgi:hypothetical protein